MIEYEDTTSLILDCLLNVTTIIINWILTLKTLIAKISAIVV